MKALIILTALATAPLANIATAQSDTQTLKKIIAEQNRQINELRGEVSDLQSRLKLQQSRSGNKTSSTRTSGTYKVVAGDTMSKIAKKQGISLKALVAANPKVNPNKMAIGQQLNIPGKTTSVSKNPVKAVEKTAGKEENKISTGHKTYKVKKGDNFYRIARAHGLSEAQLKAANPGVKPRKLQIGQVINLTVKTTNKKITKTTSKPTPRQTAQKPISKTEATKSVTKNTEPLPPAPVKEEPQPVEQPVAKTVQVTKVINYGDFARNHQTTVEQLNTLNGLDLKADEPLQIGSYLYVPTAN